MRVLWFSVTPSMYCEGTSGGWIASLEDVIRKYCNDIDLAVAFIHTDKWFKKKEGNVTYYPIRPYGSKLDILQCKLNRSKEWKFLKPHMINIIKDFCPDIIQCFGSEWPFALISQEVKIPVVVHMQGFMNVYNMSGLFSYSNFDAFLYAFPKLMPLLNAAFRNYRIQFSNAREKEIMRTNHYFMGRTEWDYKIVKYYSCKSRYYYCSEAIRPEIYDSYVTWKSPSSKKKLIVTITQAGILKGNEIILRTAKLLKDEFDYNFEWQVAGNLDEFEKFEKKTGINHNDVNVRLIGMIDAKTIAMKLASAHVYVHPAIIDNSPNSLCEAQLIGCPVIAANVGGISSLIEDGSTGILYPYNEPHMLAFNIMQYCDNEDMLNSISKSEKIVSKKRHDPFSISNQLVNIYKDIIENH